MNAETQNVEALAEVLHDIECRSGWACSGYLDHVKHMNEGSIVRKMFPDRPLTHYDPYAETAQSLLASDWLAEHVARHVSEALEQAAQRVEDFAKNGEVPYGIGMGWRAGAQFAACLIRAGIDTEVGL